MSTRSAIERIAGLLESADGNNRVFPPTDLYNEGWMLRLVLDWFSQNGSIDHQLQFAEQARWYSEALLPSAFLPRTRGDKLAESWTHADGVIGHFEIGAGGAGDLSLMPHATQLIVTEAKIFSKLSPGVTNARYFNQAARNVACIAEVAKRASIEPSSFQNIAFFVIAPQSRIDEGVFARFMTKDDIESIVCRRVDEYGDDERIKWLEDWFLPTLRKSNIGCIAWEDVLAVISKNDTREGECLRQFYTRCLEFNRILENRFG